MTLPLKIVNRLRLGRGVAAEVFTPYLDYQSWIHVEPLFETDGLAFTNPDYGLERKVSGTVIPIGYEIRHIRLHIKYLKYRYDLDRAWEDKLTLDERTIAADEIELAEFLLRWLSDLSLLRVPSNVAYPWLPRKPI